MGPSPRGIQGGYQAEPAPSEQDVPGEQVFPHSCRPGSSVFQDSIVSGIGLSIHLAPGYLRILSPVPTRLHGSAQGLAILSSLLEGGNPLGGGRRGDEEHAGHRHGQGHQKQQGPRKPSPPRISWIGLQRKRPLLPCSDFHRNSGLNLILTPPSAFHEWVVSPFEATKVAFRRMSSPRLTCFPVLCAHLGLAGIGRGPPSLFCADRPLPATRRQGCPCLT